MKPKNTSLSSMASSSSSSPTTTSTLFETACCEGRDVARVYSGGLLVLRKGRPRVHLGVDDIVGCAVAGSTTLTVTAYPNWRSKTRNNDRRIDVELPCPDAASCLALRAAIDGQLPRPPAGKRVVVLVNPFGGKKRAGKLWAKVAPLFALAGVDTAVRETERPMHAYEIARDLDLATTSALVTVSGDGLLHEAVQGLAARPDFSPELMAAVPIGIIPGGSGNGLAASLGAFDETTGALVAIKGRTRPFDLFSAVQEGDAGAPRFGFLTLEWCVVADIDIDSEEHRWMGGARFTFTALGKVFSNRAYRGRLTMWGEEGGRALIKEPCSGLAAGCRYCGPGKEPPRAEQAALPVTGAPWLDKAALVERLGAPLAEAEGDFNFFLAANTSHMSRDSIGAMTAHFSDGLIDVTYAQDCDKSDMVGILLALDEGKHHKKAKVRHHRVSELLLEVDPQLQGKLVVDGELVPYRNIRIKVHPGLATLLSK
jgi:sphingosine kinase